LEEQGESPYTAVEMIGFLDKDQKGYVSEEEFKNYFEKG
jgi:Ca2+-binding EF-hand superfamily protein